MVNLDIYSFCEDCPRFKATSTTCTAYGDNESLWVNTNVTCENSEFCGNLYNYLKKIFENKPPKLPETFIIKRQKTLNDVIALELYTKGYVDGVTAMKFEMKAEEERKR